MIIKNSGSGYYIIGNVLFILQDNTGIPRLDAVVQEFATKELLMDAHREQFPEQYVDD